MKGFSISRAVAAGFSACVIAGATGAEAISSAAFMARIAGVYTEQFPDSLAPPVPFPSENRIEVVPVDDTHAYIRMQLEFPMNHMGAIYGIATYNGHDSLVYDNGKSGSGKCALKLTWSKAYVYTFTNQRKTPGCRDYHDGPGSPDKISFTMAKRRDITDVQRLKDSREFRAAMDDYRAHAPQ